MELEKQTQISLKEILVSEHFIDIIEFFKKELSLALNIESAILFLINNENELFLLNNQKDVEDSEWTLINEFFRRQENILINYNSEIAKLHELKNSILIFNLAINENSNQIPLGVLFLRAKPNNLFYDTDLQTIKNVFDIFVKTVKNGLYKDGQIYIPLQNSLFMLMENSRLNYINQDLQKKFYSLLEVSNIINSSKKLEEMIQNVLESAAKVLRAESASLFLIDKQTGDLVFDIITGKSNLKGIRIPKGKGIAGKCAETQKSFIVNDVRSNPDFYQDVDKISHTTTRNLIACPLVVHNEVIGVIEVINTLDRSEFSQEDLELFRSFSDSVAIALQRRKLMDEIERTNIQLEQKVRELTTLHKIAQILVENQDIQVIARNVLNTIQNELKINRLSFVVYDYNFKKFHILANIGFQIHDWEISPKLIQFVFEKKIPFYIRNFDDIPELQPYITPERYQSKSAILIPLIKSNGSPFAVLCATEPHGKLHFENDDFRILLTIGSQVSKTYESIEYAGIQKEIEITARIQKNILPTDISKHHELEFFANTIPAKTTGGDFFDYYIESPYGDAYFVIADVSGKSLPAAIFMAVASSILRTVMRKEHDPSKILLHSNELLFEESESGMFVTVFLAKYNSKEGILEYATAGHNHMILVHEDGSYDLLNAKGFPLGVLKSTEIHYDKKTIPLKDGDILVLYTDGVTESTDNENQEYGIERLVRKVIEHRHLKSEEIIKKIYDDVVHYTNKDILDDDFTLLICKFSLRFKKNSFSLILPAKVESVPKLINEIYRILRRFQTSEDILNDILLACDEIATNIVSYAYKGLNVHKPIFKCKIRYQNKKIIITFIDKGKEYNFYNLQKPDIQKNLLGEKVGGFGIYLIHTLMDKVRYVHKDGVNFLTIIKQI
ncbi:MAG: SpoIIE family protein phosphatase [Leptospiraceae bacterium]|nr:SpoIIE family protein phosphatase [Leptospiraceae bacterium]MDW7975355.1 SpoIIE family protein phosphatase [Leptospiraceae bacterium]